jgi:hypothetical protein
MTRTEEISALVNTYAYNQSKKVYDYMSILIDNLERENLTLRRHVTRLKNEKKGMSKNLLETENKRLRKQNQEQLEQIKQLRKSLRKARGLA